MLSDLISGSSVKTINTSEFASNGWQFQITRINPSLAKAFLGSNFGNRKFRPGVVKRYSAAMRAGGWMLTTEAIVFDSEGFLMNGQHRLMAVIESGVSSDFLVIRGVDRKVFKTIDRGATRSVSDALGIDKKLAEVSRLAGVFLSGSGGVVTDDVCAEMAEFLEGPHSELMDSCRTATAGVSAAPIRLAACLRLVTSRDKDYILELYRNLVLSHLSELPPIGQAFVARRLAGKNRGAGFMFQKEFFAVGFKVFDKSARDATRIVVSRPDAAVAEAVQIIRGGSA